MMMVSHCGSLPKATGLGFQTVRTIIDGADGVDHATLGRLRRIAPDKHAEARARSRKRLRDALPNRITETLKEGEMLAKAAKGVC